MTLFELSRKMSRTLRATLMPAFVFVCVPYVVSGVSADDRLFTQPQLLPGDATLGAPVGMKVESDDARGGVVDREGT